MHGKRTACILAVDKLCLQYLHIVLPGSEIYANAACCTRMLLSVPHSYGREILRLVLMGPGQSF